MANLPTSDLQFSRFVKVANWLFNKLLASEDKVSLHACEGLLQNSPPLYRALTRTLSEQAAAEMLFVDYPGQRDLSIWIRQLVFGVANQCKWFKKTVCSHHS